MRSLVLDTFCKKDLEKVRQAKFAGAVGHMISEEMRELAKRFMYRSSGGGIIAHGENQ